MQDRRRDPLSIGRPARTFWFVTVAVFVLDQVAKSVVRAAWDEQAPKIILDRVAASLMSVRVDGDSVPVLGEVLKLTLVHNQGAAFGIFPGYQPMFIVTSLLVLFVIGVFWFRSRPNAWPVVLGLAFASAGAAGNLVDRTLIGTVTDFFHIAIIDFPVFNIADMSVLAGVFLLVAWLLFGPQPDKDAEQPSAPLGKDETGESAPIVATDLREDSL